MDLFVLGIVLLGGFLWGRSYEASAQEKERARRAYFALGTEDKLIDQIEKGLDVREIQRLLDIAQLDASRSADGVTPIIATMRFIPDMNYQNRARRYRILREIAKRLSKEQLVAAVNAQDNKGWTALMHAAAQSESVGGALLIHLGADPRLRNNSGETAADICRQWPSSVPVFEGRDVPPIFPKLLAETPEGKWP